MKRRRVLVLTEMYSPETANTAKFMSGIADAIAADHDVHVLAAQPTYDQRGISAPSREQRGAIEIERLPSTTFDRHRLALRLVNTATLLVSFAFYGLLRVRKADAVLVVTNPPFMPLVAELLAWTAGIPCIVLVHDVYPHTLVAAGITRRRSLLWRVLFPVFSFAFRHADRVVVLAADMGRLLTAEFGVQAERVTIIPNWGDEDAIYPDAEARAEMRERLGMRERFVVQVMGNMGRTHGLDAVLDAASELKASPDIHFLLVGGGKQSNYVKGEIERRKLGNATLMPTCSASDLRGMLNAADAAVITFRSGMGGVSVPSRMYNCLAAGQILLTLADEMSEPTELVRKHGCGITLQPGDSGALAAAVLRLTSAEAERKEMGERGRALFLETFRYSQLAGVWQRYFTTLFSSANVGARPPRDA
jgi:colanic acid biosynthesis glycosyl transferase WcaI